MSCSGRPTANAAASPLNSVFDGRDEGVTGMRRRGSVRLLASLTLSCGLACTMPPGGGVSGTVADASGKALPGVELTLTTTPRILGIPVPFANPERVPVRTDGLGHFRVLWSHGDRHEGPLLEMRVHGYASVAEQLPLGTAECRIVLATTGATAERSIANCRQVRQPG